MSYEIPQCSCGGTLFYSTEHVFKVNRQLNKNGTISKNQKIVMELGNSSCYGYEYLLCKRCLKEYVFDYDKKNRITNLRSSEEVV